VEARELSGLTLAVPLPAQTPTLVELASSRVVGVEAQLPQVKVTRLARTVAKVLP
jgi:hypothetical protein